MTWWWHISISLNLDGRFKNICLVKFQSIAYMVYHGTSHLHTSSQIHFTELIWYHFKCLKPTNGKICFDNRRLWNRINMIKFQGQRHENKPCMTWGSKVTLYSTTTWCFIFCLCTENASVPTKTMNLSYVTYDRMKNNSCLCLTAGVTSSQGLSCEILTN